MSLRGWNEQSGNWLNNMNFCFTKNWIGPRFYSFSSNFLTYKPACPLLKCLIQTPQHFSKHIVCAKRDIWKTGTSHRRTRSYVPAEVRCLYHWNLYRMDKRKTGHLCKMDALLCSCEQSLLKITSEDGTKKKVQTLRAKSKKVVSCILPRIDQTTLMDFKVYVGFKIIVMK